VTYGDVAGRLREEMTWLLERHRILQLIGGAGTFRIPVTTTEAERAVLGEEIQRYRAAVLTYCLEAVQAVTPGANLHGSQRKRDPAVALRYQVERAHGALPAGPALSALLERRPAFELVSRWQDAGRLAVQGEREIGTLQRTSLSREQQRVVLKDAADVVRGLVVLDIRYSNVPGWRYLEQKSRLLTAADAVSEHLAGSEMDVSVDGVGWRPAPGAIEGPALPGLAGVLQAQHNVVVGLTQFPSAYNLRHVLVAQAELSKHAARVAQAVGSPTASRFGERAELYRDLVTASRTVGGELGSGRHAALESANAARRMHTGPGPGENLEKALSRLVHLDDRVDVKVAAAVEHGFQEKLYFVAVKLPALGRPGTDGIVRAATKWVPGASQIQSELVGLVRERVRPRPVLVMPADWQGSGVRSAFEAVIQLERSAAARSGPRP